MGRRDQVRYTLWLASHRVTAVRSTLGEAWSRQEANLVEKLDGYYAWAQADLDVARLIPEGTIGKPTIFIGDT